MTAYRFGVAVPGQATLFYDRPTFEEAAFAWSLIRDYGREEVQALVQRREDDGLWTTVLGLNRA
jgi:hypothetical protein